MEKIVNLEQRESTNSQEVNGYEKSLSYRVKSKIGYLARKVRGAVFGISMLGASLSACDDQAGEIYNNGEVVDMNDVRDGGDTRNGMDTSADTSTGGDTVQVDVNSDASMDTRIDEDVLDAISDLDTNMLDTNQTGDMTDTVDTDPEVNTCEVDCPAVFIACCSNGDVSCDLDEIETCDFNSIEGMEGCSVTDVFDWTRDSIDGEECNQVLDQIERIATANSCETESRGTIRSIACNSVGGSNYTGFDIDDVINCQ